MFYKFYIDPLIKCFINGIHIDIKMQLQIFLLCLCYISVFGDENYTVPEGWGLDFFQYLDLYNYGHENHHVTTEDGYILGLHRITSSPRNSNKGQKPVVFLMHGLESSSVDFINIGPEKALGLMLSDKGYDVWLGNNRGNTWSSNHTTLKLSDKKFYDFSFHEVGKYDLPAMIDYVLNNTKVENLTYIGHSQGTTAFFVMESLKPEYNEKINLMVALAPIAYMKHMKNWIPNLLANPIINLAFGMGIQSSHIYNVIPHMKILPSVAKTMCHDGAKYQELCAQIIFAAAGPSTQMNMTLLPVVLTNTPAGASTRQLMHYVQELKSGYFRQFDYGLIKNRKLYNSDEPPKYNIKNIKTPVALFYAENDWFAAVEDVQTFAKDLPNVVSMNKVKWAQFTHLDFIWAKDLKELVNDDVMAILNQYNSISVPNKQHKLIQNLGISLCCILQLYLFL